MQRLFFVLQRDFRAVLGAGSGILAGVLRPFYGIGVLIDVFDVLDLVNDEFVVAAPGEGAAVFPIVELDETAALAHQQLRHFLVVHREVKFVGLQAGTGTADRTFGGEAGLDETAFVGLENDALADDEIEFAGFRSLSEYKIKMEIENSGSGQNADDAEPDDDFFQQVHVRYK